MRYLKLLAFIIAIFSFIFIYYCSNDSNDESGSTESSDYTIGDSNDESDLSETSEYSVKSDSSESPECTITGEECNPGEQKKCGTNIGECKEGTQLCDECGFWGECVGAIFPKDELCDGLDNNCDGTIDEKCECQEGKTLECGTNIGECKKGTQECIDGKWGECVGAISPTSEECDGLDNDCDGEIDNNLITPNCELQLGVCAGSKKVCGGKGGWLPCDYGEKYIENEDGSIDKNYCDGLDNDCDGEIDEKCYCQE